MNPFLKQPERYWRGVGLHPKIRTIEKPKLVLVGSAPIEAPDIFIDVVGLRSDGCEFTIPVGIDSDKLGQVSGPDCMLAMHQQLVIAFAKLQTYLACECHKDHVCKTHEPPVPN